MAGKTLEEQLAAANKALKDTKAAYTKATQALKAQEAEFNVYKTIASIEIPEDIEKLKETSPDAYIAKRAEFLESTKTKMAQAAKQAEDAAKVTTMSEALVEHGYTLEKLQANIPPVLMKKYESGEVQAEQLVKMAKEFETGTKAPASPTTPGVVDFGTVAGEQFSAEGGGLEKDETLDPNNYIL